MTIDPNAILALLSDLAQQVAAARQQVAELEDENARLKQHGERLAQALAARAD